MLVYHHHRIETYANDESQAKLTLLLEGLMALVCTALIIAGVMSIHACSL
jgi:hypothetical protein